MKKKRYKGEKRRRKINRSDAPSLAKSKMPRKKPSRSSKPTYEEVFEEPIEKTGNFPRVRKLNYKNDSQREVCEIVQNNTLTFIGGPAGTAKTLMSVSEMVNALKDKSVKRGIISRPTVEASASIGYLPGDFKEKLDPYLRPIYDCLEFFVGPEWGRRLVEDGIIEIVPFSYMRGRTFQDSFIILDEAQNCTQKELKLALTRIGFGSKCVVTYDESQLDIRKEISCINDIPRFDNRKQIGYFKFSNEDIVRSEIVSRVLEIYDSKE